MAALGIVREGGRRVVVRLAVALASAAVLTGLSAAQVSVQAATNSTGYHEPAVVDCSVLLDNSMLVHWPLTLSAPVTVPDNVFVVGDPHPQTVAYRATLVRWDGSKWVKTTTQGRWIRTVVPQYLSNLVYSGYQEFNGTAWIDSQTNGATYFRHLAPGYYTVVVDYHWYADTQVTTPGDDAMVSTTHYVLTPNYQQFVMPYCTY